MKRFIMAVSALLVSFAMWGQSTKEVNQFLTNLTGKWGLHEGDWGMGAMDLVILYDGTDIVFSYPATIVININERNAEYLTKEGHWDDGKKAVVLNYRIQSYFYSDDSWRDSEYCISIPYQLLSAEMLSCTVYEKHDGIERTERSILYKQ